MEEKINWQSLEHFHTEKGVEWYWAVGIIAGGSAVAAILLSNFVFAVLIVIAAFSLMMFASQPPKIVDVEINGRGVMFGEYFYPYNSLDSFWIDLEHVAPKVIIKSKKLLMHLVSVHLSEESDPEEIRDFLIE